MVKSTVSDDRIGDVVIKEIKKHGIVLSSGEKSKEISFEDYIVLKEKIKMKKLYFILLTIIIMAMAAPLRK